MLPARSFSLIRSLSCSSSPSKPLASFCRPDPRIFETSGVLTPSSPAPSTGATTHGDGQVSRSVILQSALRIVDRDGVDGLSMRRLSDEVGRDPTVIYRHVPNKAALLDGVADIVLGQLRVDTADPDWTGQLRAVAHDFRRLALAHPNVVPLLVTRPLATPLGQRPIGMLRPLEDVLTLLISAGFIGADALHVYRVLFGYLHGHILTEMQEVIERPDETDDVLRLGLHRLPVTQFPHLRALASALANYDGAAELDRGLDILLFGLTATATSPDGPSRG
jgi:AcrR family transcriptional regulator